MTEDTALQPSEMDDALRAWVEALSAVGSQAVAHRGKRVVEIAVARSGEFNIGRAPPGYRLNVKVQSGVRSLLLSSVGNPPDRLELQTGPDATHIEVDAELGYLAIHGEHAGHHVELVLRRSCGSLKLSMAEVVLRGETALPVLWLENVTLDASPGNFEVLYLKGDIGIGQVTVRRVLLQQRVQVRLAGEVHVYELLSAAEGVPAVLAVEGPRQIDIAWCPGPTVVELSGNCSLLVGGAGMPEGKEITGLEVNGAGRFEVQRGRLSGTVFAPARIRQLQLDLASGAELLDATGSVYLGSCSPGSVCIGSRGEPLNLEGVGQVKGAELENLNLYSLTLSELGALAEALRITPWIPSRRAHAQKLEDAMMVGAKNAESARIRRAHFWSLLSRILAEKHAPGDVQSRVRYAALRARRKAATFGREKILLSVYGLIGYGERVWRPVWLHGLLSLGAAFALTRPSGSPLLDLEVTRPLPNVFVQVVLSPLAFFRFVEAPDVIGLGSRATLVLVQALGILLLFFALSAIRRVAKAE